MHPFKEYALQVQILKDFKIPYTRLLQEWNNRDRLVLSKGHGCYALYAILTDLDIIPYFQWEGLGISGKLKGCVEYFPEWGLEAGTGSLGHGLPMAVGMAYAAKLQKLPWHTYCIVGDGELQEGSCWESMHFLNENGIDNITVIVDLNGFKALESTSNLAENFTDWIYCDGHDMKDIIDRLSGKYLTVIAKTIKGKGLKCMEGISKFHYRVPDEAEICEGKTYGQE
jgi:transketolase